MSDTDDLCTTCNGSGEGMYEGAVCSACGGRGVPRQEKDWEAEIDAEEARREDWR